MLQPRNTEFGDTGDRLPPAEHDPDIHIPIRNIRSLLNEENDFWERLADFTSIDSAYTGSRSKTVGSASEVMIDGAREQIVQIFALMDGFHVRHTQVLSDAVTDQAVLLQGRDILLEEQIKRQKCLWRFFQKYPWAKTIMLNELLKKGLLSPSPEIHWRVNRSEAEYDRRFGFSLSAFTEHFQKEGGSCTVEFGPGSGMAKKERSKKNGATGVDMAICDKIYYSLGDLLKNLIDFTHVEKLAREAYKHRHDTVPEDLHLSAADRDFLCDFLHKVLVIQGGQTASNTFEYDKEVLSALERDPESLRDILVRKAYLLLQSPCVPDTISNHANGEVHYPRKIFAPDPHAQPLVFAALGILATRSADCLKRTTDILSHVPVFPVGVMAGDFGDTRNLANHQIDFALGVRSLVYKCGEKYIDMMKTIADKLSEDGVLICDSFRDNDGHRSRVAEWVKIQKRLSREHPKMQIGVLIGPAFENEDHYQGPEGVPLAVVMTQDPSKIAYLQDPAHMLPADGRTGAAYRFVAFDELCSNTEYLRKLTLNGELPAEVEAAMSA